MRPLCSLVLAAVVSACAPSDDDVERSDASIVADFSRQVCTFERLRDMILAEPHCDAVWRDHYEWVEPCMGTYSCSRWISEPPTPMTLVVLCGMPFSRAAAYLDGLREIGALRLQRDSTRFARRYSDADDVTFTIRFSGIVTSGSESDVVWRSTVPSAMKGGREANGFDYTPLSSPGWFLRREWN